MANVAVRANAVVQKSPARITLTWSADDKATEYKIFRKLKAENTSKFAILSTITTGAATAASYTDNAVQAGVAYEYKIRKTTANPSATGEGYVLAGIEVPATEYRGKLVLLVRNTHAAALSTELNRLQQDLIGDGWQVIRHDIADNQTPPQVRALIQADYQAAPTQVKALLLLGKVPVPYSGLMFPDGHTDHKGAWPADGYYGDMNDGWTDTQVNTTEASRAANHNVPGDGKFDQSQLPSNLELEVGRVDLSNLPAFAASEVELLRRYLNKDHQYRHKVFTVSERGLIDDVFATPKEGFANNGWRNFSATVGAAQTSEADYFGTLRTQDYLWAFGGGGGTYTSAQGIGTTNDFASGPVKSVFNMLFGSYFGDWDSQNNFLRACIAAEGYTLTNCWAGRPNWHFHHMALGETVGYGARLSQNNGFGDYTSNSSARGVHMGLMGDPTLRLHPVRPATNLAIAAGLPALSWTASPEAGLGYHVYRAASLNAPFTRLTTTPLAATSFTDSAPLAGNNVYMVRAVRLQNSASGSYVNLSQGIFGTFTNAGNPLSASAGAALAPLAVYPTRFGAGQPLTVELTLPATTTVHLQLLDAVGRTCWQANYSAHAGLNRWVVAPGAAPAGMYVLVARPAAGMSAQHRRIVRE